MKRILKFSSGSWLLASPTPKPHLPRKKFWRRHCFQLKILLKRLPKRGIPVIQTRLRICVHVYVNKSDSLYWSSPLVLVSVWDNDLQTWLCTADIMWPLTPASLYFVSIMDKITTAAQFIKHAAFLVNHIYARGHWLCTRRQSWHILAALKPTKPFSARCRDINRATGVAAGDGNAPV